MLEESTLNIKALEANRNIEARNYWRNRLLNLEFQEYFNDFNNLTSSVDNEFAEYSVKATDQINNIIRDIAGSDTAKHIVLLSILGILTQKYSSISDVNIFTLNSSVKSPLNGGNNIIAVRINNFSNINFPEFLNVLKDNVVNDFKHGNYPIQKILNREEKEIKELSSIGMLVEDFQQNSGLDFLSLDILFSFNLNNSLELKIKYNTRKFDAKYIVKLAKLYFDLFLKLIKNKEKCIEDIELVSEEEKLNIINEFNQTEKEFPYDQTILDLFEKQVVKTPDNIALQFNNQQLTYKELNLKSNQVANYLFENFKGEKSVVGLLLDRSIEMMVAIFGILKAGCVYLPLSKNYPLERLKYVLKNSQAEVLLTDNLNSSELSEEFKCIDVSDLSAYSKNNINNAKPHDIAYIIYTSGSTGKPKGVLIKHRSLVNRLNWMQNQYNLTECDVILQKTTIVFDVSIWELFWWSLYGAKLVLAKPGAEKEPDEICKIIESKKISVLHFVPSMLNVFLYYLTENNYKYSLGSIKHLFSSGEELNTDDAQLFLKYYKHVNLHNLYGPTEATVDVSYHQVSTSKDYKRIPIGKPIDNTTLFIFNKENQIQPIGIPGELCIGGENLSIGYLNQAELTNSRFILNPLDNNSILYKTGDLARYLQNGEIEYLGRLDNQVKIRGNRIELGEIELAIKSFKGVENSIVLINDSNSSLKINAYIIKSFDFSEEELRSYLGSKLPDYMIPAYFIIINNIPLTVNGKVNKKELLSLNTTSTLNYVAATSALEKTLVQHWIKILKLEHIGIDDNFYRIGGDSILAVRLLGSLNNELKLNISMSDFMENQSIRLLSTLIDSYNLKEVESQYESIDNELDEFNITYLNNKEKELIEFVYPMSDIEKGMCFVHLANADDILYFEQNVIQIFYENFDFGLFRQAIDLMIHKHPILRTGLDLEMFAHVVYKYLEPNITLIDLSKLTKEKQKERILVDLHKSRNLHFDISNPPLWRITIYRLGKHYQQMVIELHHAIMDGWSFASLLTELNNTYGILVKGEDYQLLDLKSSYRDYIKEELFQKQNKEALGFWKSEFNDYKKLSLGVNSKNKKYKTIQKAYPLQLSDKLESLAQTKNTSIKHLFFAAYVYALKMLTYENDIIVGLVGFNRPLKEDGDKLLGCFLNTIPVRIKIPSKITWNEYIDLVDKKLHEIKKYDALSLFEIKQTTGSKIEDVNPFFDTLFNFINFHILQDIKPEKVVENKNDNIEFDNFLRGHTLFDVNMIVNREGVSAKYDYVSSFISDEMLNKFIIYYETIISLFIEHLDEVTDNQQIICEEERKEILFKFNNTKADYPKDKTIYQLFEEQVERVPNNVALVLDGDKMTYHELNMKSDQLARFLVNKGVKSDTIVSVIVERSFEMMIGIYGILRSGAAYLPISPSYPEERIKFILEDSESKVFLTQNKYQGKWSHISEEINLDDESIYLDKPSLKKNSISSSDLAYVIYTSGTTGKPKGVMIENHSVINRIIWMQKEYPINESDVLIQKTPFTFDVSVWELFWWSFKGASLALIESGAEREPQMILEAINQFKVSVIHFVPSMLDIFLNHVKANEQQSEFGELKYVFSSGEALKVNQVEKFYELLKMNKAPLLINLYGPTEATVDVSYYNCIKEQNYNIIPIGKPIDNTQLYIVNSDMKMQPIGVIGELCIAGVGLARGYLKRLDLTADKFIDNPFTKGTKLYRTGDLARWMDDGNIEFLGRIDHQVKIRGFRIELGEIENVLLTHSKVKECAVNAHENNGGSYLCAYLVVNDIEFNNIVELKEFLAKSLPDYMIPAHFVFLDKLPLSSNGKVNRKELLPPEILVNGDYKGASNEIEEKLVSIWSYVLNIPIEQISTNASFFDLGGHSLNATVVLLRISKEFDIKIPFSDLLKTPTIQNIAMIIFQFSNTEDYDEEIEI